MTHSRSVFTSRLASVPLAVLAMGSALLAQSNGDNPSVFQLRSAETSQATLPYDQQTGREEPVWFTGDLETLNERSSVWPRQESAIELTSDEEPGSQTPADEPASLFRLNEPAGCRAGCSLDCENSLWRTPDMIGDLFRLGGQNQVTFRPQVRNPTAATGIVVLDVASNRLVFVDGTGTMLIPGNANLVPGATFDTFREPGGGILTPTTSGGLTGHFGLQRQQNVVGGASTNATPFDVLELGTTQTIIDPISASMAVSQQHTAHFRIITNTSANPGFGHVGLVKQAMGGSPLTRDRVFFHYDYFDNVALGPGVNSPLKNAGCCWS